MADTTNRVTSRPPYSYVGLITYAIQMSPKKRLTLWQIRDFLTKHLPTVFPPDSTKLQNVLRSQLTHNSCFYRVPHDRTVVGSRRCSNWCVDLTLVDEATFKRRVYRCKFADTWPDEIHTYLDVPKIVLPTKLKSTSVRAVNSTSHNYSGEDHSLSEPACKRPRTDLAFGIDRILSESFGCTPSATTSSEIINRPSCALQGSSASPSFPMDYSVEHPRLEYPSCNYSLDIPFLTSFESVCSFPSLSDIHSFDSEFLLQDTTIESSLTSESLYVMNSTRNQSG
ncbi:hypothetical protein FSP39_021308 [Pinctada imbricata]|uniref:Fork-head domain-containing protein n=1 Tax=Pinctada imbricata TaxID=66713 RepID=A0AA89BY23_PINIB|nr:hypothetical protein FSP39_021308 [Pinctada imbricata]